MNIESFQAKTFLFGIFGGFCGTILSHPFDTVRVVYQEGSYKNIAECTKHLYKTNGITAFYKGLLPPLVGVALEKCALFGVYDNVKRCNSLFNNNTYSNTFMSGLFAGLVTTTIVTPVEKIKILLQNQKHADIKTLVRGSPLSLYNGWTATLFREVPGYGIYFTVYEYLKNTFGMPNYYTPAIYGALCGVASWTFIYPADPIKTKMQNNSIGFKEALGIIMRNEGLMGLYRGMPLALFRAIPLHGGVFMGYEFCNRNFLL
jgi:hypothetical protein